MSDSSKETEIGAVVLAAGPSTRMGTPKQLLEFRGQTFLGRAASVALQADCRPVIVVTGANAAASREALRGLAVREVENKQWESGMSSSVRIAVEAMITGAPGTSGIVLMLCDQPLVAPRTITSLVALYRETGCAIIASGYGGSYGVPALFGREHFAELSALTGTTGAKQVIQKHLAKVHLLPFPEGEIDVDTPDDFARLQSM